jgi:plastocyanin
LLLPVIGLLDAVLLLSSGRADAAGHTATIQDFSFGPTQLLIGAGESVTWTKSGPSQHTVVAIIGAVPVTLGRVVRRRAAARKPAA